jgi:hypothetical protein
MEQHSRQHPRSIFTVEEDVQLVQAVEDLGTDSWVAVSARVPARNARQCRDRWRNYLAPDIDNGPWTAAEEDLLIAKQAELGAAWKQISQFFPSRTDINIKSKWHQIQRRWRRAARRVEPEVPPPPPESPPNPETVFEQIWKAHMQTDEIATYMVYGAWQ